MKELIAQHIIEGQFPVLWYWDTEGEQIHTVTYGCQVYNTLICGEAAEMFGLNVLHQATYAGRMEE